MSADTTNMAFRAQLVIDEQRTLFDYWLRCAGARRMPVRSDIAPQDFPRLLPAISLIERDAGGRLRVRLAGTRLREIYDREITGLYLDELNAGEKADYWQAAYERVVETGRPSQGAVRGPRLSKDHLVQFWLRLPLAGADGGVAMMLCHDVFLPAAMVTQREMTTGAAVVSAAEAVTHAMRA